MTQMSIAEAIRQGIREEMRRDPLVFCIGEDIGIPGGFGGAFTVTLGLSDEFGHERILDTPISELGLAGVAVGAAMAGLRPIADVQYSDFLFLAMDQLVNNAAKMTYMSGGVAKVPMVMRAPVGATARGSQHAQSMEAFFCHVPGLKVVAPATAYDAKGLLKAAVRDDNPVHRLRAQAALRQQGPAHRARRAQPVGEVPDEDYLVPIGKGIIRRPGKDVTIVGKLLTMYRALAAAEELAKDGIDAEVIDPRTLVPLDKELILESVQEDRPAGDRRGGQPHRRLGRRAGRHRRRGGVLLAGRADQARLRARRAAPLRAGDGAVLRAVGRAGGRGGEGVVLMTDDEMTTDLHGSAEVDPCRSDSNPSSDVPIQRGNHANRSAGSPLGANR